MKVPSDVMAAIIRAAELTAEARSACAEADAMVATYWKQVNDSDERHWWLSADVRSAADLAATLALHQQMRAATLDHGDTQ